MGVNAPDNRGALAQEPAVVATGKEFEESEEHRGLGILNQPTPASLGKAEGRLALALPPPARPAKDAVCLKT